MNDKRVTAGQPTGGEFAAHTRAASDVTLSQPTAPQDAWLIVEEGISLNESRYPIVDIDKFNDMAEMNEVVAFRDLADGLGLFSIADDAEGILDDCFSGGGYPERDDSERDNVTEEWRQRPQEYFVMEDGLVQNEPADDVFVLDVLTADLPWGDLKSDVVDLSRRADEAARKSEEAGTPAPGLRDIQRRCNELLSLNK